MANSAVFFIAAILWLSAGTWLLLWLRRIRPDWIEPVLPPATAPGVTGRISVIIPARDEAHALPALLNALRGNGPLDAEIIVVDDQSADGTAAVAAAAAAADPRMRVVAGRPRPQGWAGKAWALTQGVSLARGDWLLFLDADLVPDGDILGTASRAAQRDALDCLSLIPRMENRRVPVAALIGCLSVARAILFRPARPGRPGIIQGACLMVRRGVFDAASGFETIRHSLLEDVELGRLLAARGYRVGAMPAFELFGTAMYASIGAAFEGMSKHLFAAASYSWLELLRSIFMHVLLLVVPWLLPLAAWPLMAEHNAPAAIAAFASGAAVALFAMYAVIGRLLAREKLPVPAIALIPLSIIAFAGILARSVYGYRRGAIAWKGRRYPAVAGASRERQNCDV